MSVKQIYPILSIRQIRQIWILIFFTLSSSVTSAFHYDFCTKSQDTTASVSDSYGLRLSTIVKNDTAPFNADLASKSQQQMPFCFFGVSGYKYAFLDNSVNHLAIFNDYEVKSLTTIAKRKIIFPHHSFW